MKGKVYLVGAGPGDAGLITLKGKDALAKAGVVIYDNLVNRALLKWAGPRCLKIYAGKKGWGPRTEQSHVNGLVYKHARAGKTVVRLKGGDPFLFGRGGEEAEFLSRRGVPYEIVPGVSSVTAVPAYAGIPVTDRRFNSMLTIVTGRSGEDFFKGPGVQWNKISPHGTLVILMGVGTLPKTVLALVKHGWPGATPIALVRSGTLANQRVVTGTLSSIVKKLKKAKPPFSPPAVIIVGSVVNLRKKIAWFD